MVRKMNQVEWKLISELLKDSRNSDRELSKRLGVSQPTVSRMRHKLEKEGYLREYTIMPDFRKLGFNLAAICFVKFKDGLDSRQQEEMRKRATQRFTDLSFAPNVIFFERGLGFGHTGMLVSFHEDYSSFVGFLKQIKQFTVLEEEIKTFLIDLNDDVHYRSLSFVPLAHCILNRFKNEVTE